MTAINCSEVTEDFAMFNDDHFLLTPHNISELPYYHRGELRESMKKNSGNYMATLNHSRKVLMEKELPTLDFDVHFPIIYNKEKFENTVGKLNWNIDYGYAIKSCYVGLNHIEGEFIQDCKIKGNSMRDIKIRTQGRTFFSIGTLNDDMREFLTTNYPKKSFYEA